MVEGTRGQVLDVLDLLVSATVVVDDRRQLLSARDVDHEAAHGQLVVHGCRDLGREGHRLQTAAEAAGQADQLADQALGVAVGVQGIAARQTLACTKDPISPRPRLKMDQVSARGGVSAMMPSSAMADAGQRGELHNEDGHAASARRRAAVNGGNTRAVRIWMVSGA